MAGSTWTIGYSLGVKIPLLGGQLNIGFSNSFGETATTGYQTAVGDTCGTEPDGTWTCGFQIDPSCFEMTGFCETELIGTAPWAASVPMIGEDGTGVFGGGICTCANCEGWADFGAPQPLCDLDCLKCEPTD